MRLRELIEILRPPPRPAEPRAVAWTRRAPGRTPVSARLRRRADLMTKRSLR